MDKNKVEVELVRNNDITGHRMMIGDGDYDESKDVVDYVLATGNHVYRNTIHGHDGGHKYSEPTTLNSTVHNNKNNSNSNSNSTSNNNNNNSKSNNINSKSNSNNNNSNNNNIDDNRKDNNNQRIKHNANDIIVVEKKKIDNNIDNDIPKCAIQQQSIAVQSRGVTCNPRKNRPMDDRSERKPAIGRREFLSLFSFNRRTNAKSAPTMAPFKRGYSVPAITTLLHPTEHATTKTTTTTTMAADKWPVAGAAPKFMRSSSLVRLLGGSSHAKSDMEAAAAAADAVVPCGRAGVHDCKFNTFSGRRRAKELHLERFRQTSKEDGDNVDERTRADLLQFISDGRNVRPSSSEHPEGPIVPMDFGAKAMRTLSRGLGKLWWRRSHSVDISTPDPEFKVSYLGNVLTGWAKGEGCMEKQLSTLWRNYTQNCKPDVVMRIKVCASGLKATTRQHGLTEYWSNRITHCSAPRNYPRVFCWIYRHEGRKLKHELRCHAVLCSKEKNAHTICTTLKENLERALLDFKREKILKQNARLSLANAAYENPSLPRRKILLSVGGNNYRPPLERSKSAPKLMAIEEAIGEEDGDEIEETNEPEMRSCCQKDSLYPAMTLGRRRCRRGHSIRRTGKTRSTFCEHLADVMGGVARASPDVGGVPCKSANAKEGGGLPDAAIVQRQEHAPEQRHDYGSDESDEFEKLLKCNDYDSSSSLANELLPYFDMKLHLKTSNSLGNLSDLKDEGDDDDDDDGDDDDEPLSLMVTVSDNPGAEPESGDYSDAPASRQVNRDHVAGLRRDGVCSDGEEDYLDEDDAYFRQASLLHLLHRNSMRKMTTLQLSSDESSIETNVSVPLHFSHKMQSSISSNASSTATSASVSASASSTEQTAADSAANQRNRQLHAVDSDEGSISSGCETASTLTANQDDSSLKYRQSEQQRNTVPRPMASALETAGHLLLEQVSPDAEPITAEEIYQRLESRLRGRHGSDATTFSSSSSITLKQHPSPMPSPKDNKEKAATYDGCEGDRRPTTKSDEQQSPDDSDSEWSDESGYVEFQEREVANPHFRTVATPPKPMPRRLIGANRTSAF